ncbi:MAG: two-component regulator propeller domain-containing protein [Acidobacteriota bacterium]|nr:two-component regulator propeller domain-containing protein [Acidobacteriota bacterium]
MRSKLPAFGPFFLLLFAPCPALSGEPRFDHVDSRVGLSHHTVSSVLQDSRGFLWFGTIDGLNRYDGYRCKVFRHHPRDAGSLSSSFIHCLLEDRQGHLWIGTRDGGLSVLRSEDRERGFFRRYLPRPDDPNSLSHVMVQTLYLDRSDRMWVGTAAGLDLFDRAAGRFTAYRLFDEPVTVTGLVEDADGLLWIASHRGLYALDLNRFEQIDPADCRDEVRPYRYKPDNPEGLATDMIGRLLLDKEGRLWLSTRGQGFSMLDRATGRFTHYPPATDGWVPGNPTVAFQDEEGRLWIGSDGDGLTIWDPETGASERYRHQPSRVDSLSHDNVNHIYRSRDGASGSIWVLTWGGGVNRLIPDDRPFGLVRHDPMDLNSPAGNFIFALHEDRFGDLWVGSSGAGLGRWDRPAGRWTRFVHDPADSESLSHNHVWAITEDDRGDLWLTTEQGGINQLVRKSKDDPVRFRHHRHDPNRADSLLEDNHRVFFQDRDGNLWAGGEQEGLSVLTPGNRASGRWRHFRHRPEDPDSLSENLIRCMAQDAEGMLWIGTYSGGLNRMAPSGGKVRRYRHRDSRADALSHDDVRCVLVTRGGHVWAGTYGGGLNRFHPETDGFSHLTQADGLANNFVYGMLEDGEGALWISTNRGIDRLGPDDAFTRYDTQHGVQSDEFNTGAYAAGRDGELFFGGVHGFNYFRPEAIKARTLRDRDFPPPVVITDFVIMGETVQLPREGPVRPAYDDKFFSVSFAVLDYHDTDRNRYAYMLEGFDSDWIDNGTRHYAGYTNLDPGVYTLRYRGAGSAGVWSEGTPLEIVISPPFWQTGWFRALMVLGLALAVLAGFKVKQYYQAWRGTRYVGQFKLLRKLGEGGSGVVYLAGDRVNRRTVALKVLHSRLEETRDGIRRFLQEAEIGQRLNHPHIVTIYEAGSHGKTRYISMEYIEGETLKTYRQGRAEVGLDELLTRARQILEGLTAIHELEIVHRDLKAANIMVQATGSIKIMDFGLARISALTTMENRNQLMGTLAYMSPEQTVGKAVDARADIYAFGVILYELWFGRLPFSAENEMEMIYAIHNETPPGLEGDHPLLKVIARCMAKEPNARYPDTAAVSAALDEITETAPAMLE